MRSQILPAATAALLKLLTGATPGRLFHIATRRSVGQGRTKLRSSFWLANVSKGVVAAAAASSGVVNTLMLSSASIVNVFIFGISFAAAVRRLSIHHSVCDNKQVESATALDR